MTKTKRIDPAASAPAPSNLELPARLTWLLLLALLSLGAWLRVAGLDDCAFQMDNVDFLTPILRGFTPGQIISKWTQLPITGIDHLPFPLAFTALFLNLFHLPFTFQNVMLPSAVWGLLTILAAHGLGCAVRGRRLGLLLAAFVALQPIMIQDSRLAYYYPPALLGAYVLTWALAVLYRDLQEHRRLSIKAQVLLVTGWLLCIYSDTGTWPLALVSSGLAAFLLVRAARKGRLPWNRVAVLAAAVAVLALPLLLAPWGLPHILRVTVGASGRYAAYWHSVFWNFESPWPSVVPVLMSCAWGTTAVRVLLFLLAATLGLHAIWRDRRQAPVLLWLLALAGLGLLFNIISLARMSMANFSAARAIMFTPVLFTVLALGLLEGGPWLARLRLPPRLAAAILPGMALALWAYPDWLCTRQTGRPLPHLEVARWMDAHLARNCPVVTERYFDAISEYNIHHPTNIFVMSTVKNQAIYEYLDNKFRQRTEQFMINNPVSGFIQSRLHWDNVNIGPWNFPAAFYLRQATFTNVAGLRLHRLGLNDQTTPWRRDQDDHYTRTVYYNTLADMPSFMQRAGIDILATWGEQWRYIKTDDGLDWRLMADEASVEIFNRSATTQSVVLVVHGVASGGDKSIRLSAEKFFTLPDGQLADFEIAPVPVPPGQSRLILADPLGKATKVPLLADRIQIRPYTPR